MWKGTHIHYPFTQKSKEEGIKELFVNWKSTNTLTVSPDKTLKEGMSQGEGAGEKKNENKVGGQDTCTG